MRESPVRVGCYCDQATSFMANERSNGPEQEARCNRLFFSLVGAANCAILQLAHSQTLARETIRTVNVALVSQRQNSYIEFMLAIETDSATPTWTTIADANAIETTRIELVLAKSQFDFFFFFFFFYCFLATRLVCWCEQVASRSKKRDRK